MTGRFHPASTRRGLVAGTGAALLAAVPWPVRAAAAAPLSLGVNALWMPGDEASLRARFARARALGVREVRLDWEWRAVERERGTYDWTVTDRLAALAQEAGIHLLPIVHYAPDWALVRGRKRDGIYEMAPADAAFGAYARFLLASIRRYGPGGDAPGRFDPIGHWQVWNEPNNKAFWGPVPEPRRFVQMMREVAAVLAPVRGRVQLVHAGLSKADVAFLWQLWEVDRSYGDTFDVMAVHPYIFDWKTGVRRPEDIDKDVEAEGRLGFVGSKDEPNYLSKVFNLQLFMTLRGAPDKPIWVTEMGYFVSTAWLGVSEARQAELLRDTVAFIGRKLADKDFGEGARKLPTNVQRVYWFALDDYPDPSGTGKFGLYREDGSLRESGATFRALLQ